MTSIYHLSNFDIFSPEEFVIEYTKIYLGKDILKKIISNISNYNYKGYLNNKIIQVVFTFDDINKANEFLGVLETYNLEECFNKKRFYSTIQDAILITGNLSVGISSNILDSKKTHKLFTPKSCKNKVAINIPNTRLLYIHLYNINQVSKQPIFNVGEISEYASIYLTQCLTSSNFFIKSSIMEKEMYEGNRIGIFSIIGQDLYLVCDVGLHILDLIENIFSKILNTNNIHQLNKYCTDFKDKFINFQQQVLTT